MEASAPRGSNLAAWANPLTGSTRRAAVGAIVGLSIFLRQGGFPESNRCTLNVKSRRGVRATGSATNLSGAVRGHLGQLGRRGHRSSHAPHHVRPPSHRRRVRINGRRLALLRRLPRPAVRMSARRASIRLARRLGHAVPTSRCGLVCRSIAASPSAACPARLAR